mmetsp:Transcript_8498/g.28425  ORF Transcript_8498/g.28425 Transcript_8498/m.28425 type:complete len:274 (-) Transcript_8498:481-1302(-)
MSNRRTHVPIARVPVAVFFFISFVAASRRVWVVFSNRVPPLIQHRCAVTGTVSVSVGLVEASIMPAPVPVPVPAGPRSIPTVVVVVVVAAVFPFVGTTTIVGTPVLAPPVLAVREPADFVIVPFNVPNVPFNVPHVPVPVVSFDSGRVLLLWGQRVRGGWRRVGALTCTRRIPFLRHIHDNRVTARLGFRFRGPFVHSGLGEIQGRLERHRRCVLGLRSERGCFAGCARRRRLRRNGLVVVLGQNVLLFVVAFVIFIRRSVTLPFLSHHGAVT